MNRLDYEDDIRRQARLLGKVERWDDITKAIVGALLLGFGLGFLTALYVLEGMPL